MTIPIQDVRKLDVEPGDVICVRFKGRVSSAVYDRLWTVFKGWFPEAKLLILEDGAEASVLTKDEIDELSS